MAATGSPLAPRARPLPVRPPARPRGRQDGGAPAACPEPAAGVPEEPEPAASRRPLGDLPRGLALGPSLAQEQFLGVWCVGKGLQPGRTWGPLPGPAAFKEATGPALWPQEMFQSLRLDKCVCERGSGWASLVRRASEGNVVPVWIGERLHLRVSRPVAPGAELLLGEQPAAMPGAAEDSCPGGAPAQPRPAASRLPALPARPEVLEGPETSEDRTAGCRPPGPRGGRRPGRGGGAQGRKG
ncbi:zinc finger protein 408-like, partial [Tachyglossus aculeatus]|uniref:zinc finger protein 408-like n=1 Tax=Tachyglossus aculeatus TaxID=9261 RepID=UPI0018F4E2C3